MTPEEINAQQIKAREAANAGLCSPASAGSDVVGGDFYNGIEWLACWLLDHAEGETITEEQLRPWAVEAWSAHINNPNHGGLGTGGPQ